MNFWPRCQKLKTYQNLYYRVFTSFEAGSNFGLGPEIVLISSNSGANLTTQWGQVPLYHVHMLKHVKLLPTENSGLENDHHNATVMGPLIGAR